MPTDDQQVIKIMLNGLIKRDVSAPGPDKEWLATPEGQAWEAKENDRLEARKRGDLRLVSLTDRHAGDDGFSLKMLEVDRAGCRNLRAQGYEFDAETTAWMDER